MLVAQKPTRMTTEAKNSGTTSGYVAMGKTNVEMSAQKLKPTSLAESPRSWGDV